MHCNEFGITYKSGINIITIPNSRTEIIHARVEGVGDASIRHCFQEMVGEVVQEFLLILKL